MTDLAAFLPRSCWPLLEVALAGEVARSSERGSVLFCDVAGFTPLTEALQVLGREGSEELTRLLNDYFSSMVGIVEEEGGDVLRFGGDAMTIFFPGPSRGRASRAASRMMAAMGRFGTLPTRAGPFGLSMKIGAAHGLVSVGILSDGAGGYDFYAAGKPLDESAEAEHRAVPGRIICHLSFLSGATEIPPVETLGEGFGLLSPGEVEPRPPVGVPDRPDQEMVRRIMPPYLADQSGRAISAEHRGVAVLFVALRGLSGDAPPEELHARLQDSFTALTLAARRHGGTLNKIDLGDKGAKAILLFGTPYAVEHREEMAVRAAMQLMASRDFPEGVTLSIGATSSHLFSGPVGSAGRREFTVMGDGINLAARLMQNARSGQVLCDANCSHRASGALRFRELPPITVKGKRAPVQVAEPLGEVEQQEASGATLIERESLCARIGAYLRGEGSRPLALAGEAGLGKSALLEWSMDTARELEIPAIRVPLGPFSVDRPFSAWRGPLRVLLGVRRNDSPEALREARDEALSSEPAGYRVLINPLLDLPEEPTAALKNLSPKERKDLTFAILSRLFRSGGRRLIAWDNFQHADPLSAELLSFFLEDAESAPWKILCAFRPSQVQAAAVERLETLALDPLSPAGMETLLRAVHGLTEVPKEVLAWFVDRSRGNPALAAALLAALDSANLVLRDDFGKRVDQDRLFTTAFPDTLEGLYMARVDHLQGDEREVLQYASILGYSVSVNLLHEFSGVPLDAVLKAVGGLQETGLLMPDTWGHRPYVRFSDALLRDAVYQALPFAFKRKGHLALALLLDVDAKANAKLWPTLAHHFEQGGDEAKARSYHRLAGRDSFSRYDNITALRHLEFVCKTITPDEEDVEDAFSLMDVCGFLGRWDNALMVLSRLDALDGDLVLAKRARLRYFTARDHWQNQRWDEAEWVLKEGFGLYEKAGDIAGMGKSLVNLVGGVYGPTGRLQEAKACLERALGLPRGPGQSAIRVLAAMNLGSVNKILGLSSVAEQWLIKAFRGSVRSGLGPQKGMIAGNLSALNYELGKFSQAAHWSQKAISVLETFAFRGTLLNARQLFAVSLQAMGRSSEAKEILDKLSTQARTQGHHQVASLSDQGLAKVALSEGNVEEFLSLSAVALDGFRALRNDRDFGFTLSEVGGLFYTLDARDEAKTFWLERAKWDSPDDATGGASKEAHLVRLQRWMDGDDRHVTAPDSFLELGADVSAEERLERRLWVCEGALQAGERERAARALDGARTALRDWPYLDAKLRILRVEHILGGGLTPARGKEARRLLTKGLGGVWGLRLACDLAYSARGTPRFRKLDEDALRRLEILCTHSPQWARRAVSAFPEVRALQS